MRYVPAIVIAVSILLAPVVWHLSRLLVGSAPNAVGNVVDDTARIEIERLSREIAVLRHRIAELEKQVTGRVSEPPPAAEGDNISETDVGDLLRSETNTIAEDYAKVVVIERRRRLNEGLTLPSRAYLEQVLGAPSSNLTDDCGPITNPEFSARIVADDVGNIQVTMLAPAIESLRRVFDLIRAIDVDLYERIASSGSLCVRRIRGSSAAVSSHAYGLALDINIDGQLDTLGDGRTQLGLTIIADIFQREGWYWGASFAREDSMHFEVSKELLDQWIASGRI